MLTLVLSKLDKDENYQLNLNVQSSVSIEEEVGVFIGGDKLQSIHFDQQKNYLFLHYEILEVWGPSGPRLLAGGHSGLLTSSFAHFGRSGRVTHASVIG